MAESGELQEIMASYLNSKAVFGFNTVSDLKNATNLIDGSYAKTLGYIHDIGKRFGWKIYIPKFSYTTDNAAMIAITGYYKYHDKDFCSIDKPAYSRVTI